MELKKSDASGDLPLPEKHPEVDVESCPPSPQSFLDLEGVKAQERAARRKTRRRKKGLPRYVKHKDLHERSAENLTLRQLLMVLKKRAAKGDLDTDVLLFQGLFPNSDSPHEVAAEKKPSRALPASSEGLKQGLAVDEAADWVESAMRAEAFYSFPVPVKKVVCSGPVHGIDEAKNMPGSSSVLVGENPGEGGQDIPLEEALGAAGETTHDKLITSIQEEINIHVCGLQSHLELLLRRVSTLRQSDKTPWDLLQHGMVQRLASEFLNVVRHRSTCCAHVAGAFS